MKTNEQDSLLRNAVYGRVIVEAKVARVYDIVCASFGCKLVERL